MGLISNTNSDLLNLLSSAAPSVQSPAIAADTSPVPATGSFQKILLLFPSTDVGTVAQVPSGTSGSDSMLPMMQAGSESLLMVTSIDLSSLRLFSQDGSLFTVGRGQQAPAVSSLSELERLEQAVAELQTVTLYVPPETGLNPAAAPTETTTSLQLLDPDSEKHQGHIISDEAQQTIRSSAYELQVFPQLAAAVQRSAADSRLNLHAVSEMDSESAGIGRISATSGAVADQLVSIKDAASPLALIDSDIRPVTAPVTNSVPSSPANSVLTNSAPASAVAASLLAANHSAEPFEAEALLQQPQVESTPAVRSAAGAAVAPNIPAISGDAASATSMGNPDATKVGEATIGSLSPSASSTTELAADVSPRIAADLSPAAGRESSAVVTANRESLIGEAGQPIAQTADTAAAFVSPLADHGPQPTPAAMPAATAAETSEPDSGNASSEVIAGRQGHPDKSDGRSFSQGDGSEPRQQRGAMPPIPSVAVEAVAPGVFSRAALTAVAAEQQEPELTTTPAPVSDKNSATAVNEGSASSITAVVPSVASPAVHRLLNPLDIAEQLAAEVSRRVERSVVDGQERFTMRLDPPELGELVISMRRTAGGIELHVEAADPATMNLIQNGIDQLKSDPARPSSIFQQLNIDVTTSGHGSGHPADQRRPATEAASMGRVAANVSDNAVDRTESEQISFVA